MDWFWSNAISLLWMIVVLVTAFVIYGTAAVAAATIAAAIALCGRPSEDELKRLAEEKYKSEERQQQYWKERHKHENPQCEVCKEVCKQEEEEKKRGVDIMMGWRTL